MEVNSPKGLVFWEVNSLEGLVFWEVDSPKGLVFWEVNSPKGLVFWEVNSPWKTKNPKNTLSQKLFLAISLFVLGQLSKNRA